MVIEKNIVDSVATLKTIGRLDTSTAPSLEAAIDSCASEVQSLVLDFNELDYISSAGLRVLLKAQKAFNAKSGMKVVGSNETIKEVFDITGFVDILTLE